MLRTSRLALILILILSFTAFSEDLIDTQSIVSTVGSYKTTTVQLGAYLKPGSCGASLYYPVTENVTYSGSAARIISVNVKRNSEVKAGDVIAVLRRDSDEVKLKSKALELARAEEDAASDRAEREEAIAQAQSEMELISDVYGREKARLNLELMKTEAELAYLNAQYNIDTLKAELNELTEQAGDITLTAGIDGVVTSVTAFSANQEITSGTVIAVINDESRYMFYINDEAGSLRYGMPVTITVGAAKNRVALSGRIGAAHNVLPMQNTGTAVYVTVEESTEVITNFSQPKAAYTLAYVDGVTVLSKKAQNLFSGKYYVYKLNDGTVSKRYINFGIGTVNTGIWILAGVEPGDVLITD